MRRILPLFLFAAACLSAGGGYKVQHVSDGDTIVILFNGKKESVRLIGVDAPESRKNSKAYRDSNKGSRDVEAIVKQGKKAARFVRSLLKKGDEVTLEFDIQQRDKYGRLLAYVYLSDGRMLNEVIVKSGYAAVMTIPPNVKYKERFLEAYGYARENRLGLWK